MCVVCVLEFLLFEKDIHYVLHLVLKIKSELEYPLFGGLLSQTFSNMGLPISTLSFKLLEEFLVYSQILEMCEIVF